MSIPMFIGGSALRLPDSDYYPALLNAVESARERIWAAIFILDPVPRRDGGLLVRRLGYALQAAVWRGVDVRLLTTRSDQSMNIDIANQVAFRFLEERGIPIRFLDARGARDSLHSKLVIMDRDRVALGSHNWSPEAFAASIQDTVFIHSAELNAHTADRFLRLWPQKNDAPIG